MPESRPIVLGIACRSRAGGGACRLACRIHAAARLSGDEVDGSRPGETGLSLRHGPTPFAGGRSDHPARRSASHRVRRMASAPFSPVGRRLAHRAPPSGLPWPPRGLVPATDRAHPSATGHSLSLSGLTQREREVIALAPPRALSNKVIARRSIFPSTWRSSAVAAILGSSARSTAPTRSPPPCAKDWCRLSRKLLRPRSCGHNCVPISLPTGHVRAAVPGGALTTGNHAPPESRGRDRNGGGRCEGWERWRVSPLSLRPLR